MLILEGIFKNNMFIPDHDVAVLDGTKAVVSIEDSDKKTNIESNQQKKAWQDFFEGINSLNEDLPSEFDEIIEKSIVFNQADFS